MHIILYSIVECVELSCFYTITIEVIISNKVAIIVVVNGYNVNLDMKLTF